MRVTLAVAAELGERERAAVRSARLGTLLRRCGNDLRVGARTSLTVRLSDDAELRRLNSAFRDVDSPTDVLAFPAGEPAYLGDIAISVERALGQADDGAAELRLLAVHGLLHCLGHDHHDAEDAARMTAATRRLLPGEGVPDLAPVATSEAR